ncbi:acyl carrier protein [Dactylosporangium sp. CA-139066]|uniref:acyl carrier protein n=1 Tax=Dactylosporangium sp. CA-139066 TaxID=3239930 RepID=UPI003D8C4254
MTRPDDLGADQDMWQRIYATFASRRPLDVDTNFFEAGFSSLSLAEVLTELQALGLPLALVDLYRYPTIRALGAAKAGPPRPETTPPWLVATTERGDRRTDE